MSTAISRTHIGQTSGQPVYPFNHKTIRKKDELFQKNDGQVLNNYGPESKDWILEFRMRLIQEFALAARPWFEMIKEGKPLSEPVPPAITEPLRQWLGALCDSPQIVQHARGHPIEGEFKLRVYGPGVISAMEKTPEEREASAAKSQKKPTPEEIELVKSVIFSVYCDRYIYRLNELDDKISKHPYYQARRKNPAPETAELVYFISCALNRHAMLMNGTEKRSFLNWLKQAEKMLKDIETHGDEMARTSVRVTHMRNELVVH